MNLLITFGDINLLRPTMGKQKTIQYICTTTCHELFVKTPHKEIQQLGKTMASLSQILLG